MKKLEDLKLEVYDHEFLGEERLKMVSDYVAVYTDDILSIGYNWRIDAFTVRFSYWLYEVILNDEKPDTIHYIINRAIEKNRITGYNTKELFEKMDFTKLPEYREYILEKFKDDIKNVFPHMIISYMNTLLHVDGSDETFYLSGLVVPSESDKGVIIEKKRDEKSLYTIEVEENGDIMYKGEGNNNIIIPSDENIYDYLVDEIHDSGNQIIPGRLLKLVFDKYVDSKAKELSRIYTIFKYLLVSNSFMIKPNYGGLSLEKGDKVVLLKSTDKGAVVKFVTIFTSLNPYDESTVVFGDDYTSLVRAVSRHLFGECPKKEPSEKILNDLKELLEKEYKEPYNTVIEKFTELYNESTENEGKMMVFIDYLIDKVIRIESKKSLSRYYRYIKKGTKEYDIINTMYTYLASSGREYKYFEVYTDVSDTYIASIPSVRLNVCADGYLSMETVQLDIDGNFNISMHDTIQGSMDLDILTDGFKDAYKELYLSSAINNMIIRKMDDEDLLEFNKKIKVFYSDADESVFDGIVKILEDNGILKGIGLLLDNLNGTKKN